MRISEVMLRSAVCLSLVPSTVLADTYKPECFRAASADVKTIKQDSVMASTGLRL